MDKYNTDQWLKKAEAAMNDAAPGIVASVDGLLEQRLAIMRAGLSAMVRAALDDAAQEIIANVFKGLGEGRSPRVHVVGDEGHLAGFLSTPAGERAAKTAIRRFMR